MNLHTVISCYTSLYTLRYYISHFLNRSNCQKDEWQYPSIIIITQSRVLLHSRHGIPKHTSIHAIPSRPVPSRPVPSRPVPSLPISRSRRCWKVPCWLWRVTGQIGQLTITRATPTPLGTTRPHVTYIRRPQPKQSFSRKRAPV